MSDNPEQSHTSGRLLDEPLVRWAQSQRGITNYARLMLKLAAMQYVMLGRVGFDEYPPSEAPRDARAARELIKAGLVSIDGRIPYPSLWTLHAGDLTARDAEEQS